jgi:CBS domain-containing protein
MQCGSIMRTQIEIGLTGETLQEAARRMRDANIAFLVVVDALGRLRGVVTDRDLVIRACARGLSPDQTRIEDIMSLDPPICRTDDALEWAIDVMALHQVTRIFVVDADDRPVGVLGLADLAVHLDDPAGTLRRVSAGEVFDEAHHRISRH